MSGTRFEQRNDERRLLELGRNLVAELDLQTVLEQLLEIARDVTGARYVALGILDDDGQGFAGLLTLGMDEETRSRTPGDPIKRRDPETFGGERTCKRQPSRHAWPTRR